MARRYKDARLLNNMKAAEAINKLGISQPTLSAWEGERKSPSIDALEHMADLYGVSTDFLLGRADSKSQDPDCPIPVQQLLIMNGKPVWSPQYGWMLVHAFKRQLLLSDGSYIPFFDAGDIFALPPLLSEISVFHERPFDKSELIYQTEIWIEPISTDPDLRKELRGWYRKKDRFFENEFGNRFYFDTYGAKWLAFQGDLHL